MTRKPKKSAGLGYFIILFIILILFAAAGVFVSRRFAPSKAHTDLLEYYNLTAKESMERPAAAANEMALIIDDRILDKDDTEHFRAYQYNDGVYVDISIIQAYIDNRFYLDKYEELVIFTDAVSSSIASIGSSTCNCQGKETDLGYIIARNINGNVFLNMEFVTAHSDASYAAFQEPSRVYIKNDPGEAQYVVARSEARMRVDAGKKASIVTDVPKGAKLRVLDEEDGWYLVIDESGFTGYVQVSNTGDLHTETTESGYSEPEYTHILLDGSINMVWHGIYYYESNQYVADYTYDMKGVNVLAPTWFMFADMYGDIYSYASQDYVDYAHENGWYVWAVLEDMDGESSEDILPYTTRRHAAISQVINECLTYGIDGINVDLEQFSSSEGNDFIQFIRELSVECRNNNLVLSVADYAPYSYNSYRHTDEQSKICDYVSIMAYDDYVGGSEAGPNASLGFLSEVMSLCSNVVDMDRLIVGIPFYSRIWYEYQDGTLGRETYDMNTVSDIAWNHDLTFTWQDDTGYDYAEYDDESTKVRIWYENKRSLEAKCKLLSDYDIAGIASWRLGQETSDVWDVLDKYY